ncbi:hypothetical protein [uncultured Lacinutrix sp.]|nr:hypothetical protein [uncultured Lacinutrix sp.]
MKTSPHYQNQENEALGFISNELQEEFTTVCLSLGDAIILD